MDKSRVGSGWLVDGGRARRVTHPAQATDGSALGKSQFIGVNAKWRMKPSYSIIYFIHYGFSTRFLFVSVICSAPAMYTW